MPRSEAEKSKVKRCVGKVMPKGHDKGSAYAICWSAQNKKGMGKKSK